jgi:ABC-type antimicrobial peptide transport system permease subunit
VEERRREVGIRVALGAQKPQVIAAMFRPARLAVMSGLGLGFVLSLCVGPILGELGISLFGLSPFDPLAFATVGGILATAAFAATVIPVRRALRVDPAVVLKADE